MGTTAQAGSTGDAPAVPPIDSCLTAGELTPGSLAAHDVTSEACSAAADAKSDLTWLLHRGAQRMRGLFDQAARDHGLQGARDWIVLSAIAAGPRQPQLALAHSLGLDKTTMTSLLDRLESAGLVTRCTDRRDRRARIPELTEAGLRVQHELIAARDRAEAAALGPFSAGEQRLLRVMLNRLAEGPPDDPKAAGSCM